MNTKKYPLLRAFVIAAAAFASVESRAGDFVVGGQFGSAEASDLVYGAHITAHPFDLYGFRADVTFGDGVIMANPGVIFYPVAYEEMSFGIIGGAGFIKPSGFDPIFDLNIGAIGTVKLGANFEVGLDARFIIPVQDDANSGYLVMATAGFVFDTGDSW